MIQGISIIQEIKQGEVEVVDKGQGIQAVQHHFRTLLSHHSVPRHLDPEPIELNEYPAFCQHYETAYRVVTIWRLNKLRLIHSNWIRLSDNHRGKQGCRPLTLETTVTELVCLRGRGREIDTFIG